MVNSKIFYDVMAQKKREGYLSVTKKRADYLAAIDREFVKIISETKNAKLLDVGSGDGSRIQKLIKGKQIELSALDNSENFYNLLSRNTSVAHAYNLDINNFKVQYLTFNYATALWNVWGHVSDVENAFKLIFDSLAQDGIFFFDVNNPFNLREYGFWKGSRNFINSKFGQNVKSFKLVSNGIETDVFFRPPWVYREILNRIGFKNIKLTYFNYKTGARSNMFSGQVLITCHK
jgi:SAM-dependent methyltransferase